MIQSEAIKTLLLDEPPPLPEGYTYLEIRFPEDENEQYALSLGERFPLKNTYFNAVNQLMDQIHKKQMFLLRGIEFCKSNMEVIALQDQAELLTKTVVSLIQDLSLATSIELDFKKIMETKDPLSAMLAPPQLWNE